MPEENDPNYQNHCQNKVNTIRPANSKVFIAYKVQKG